MAKPKLHLARTQDGLEHVNTLDLRPEVRRILIAEGAGFHNDQKHVSLTVPERLIDPKGSGLERYPGLSIEEIDPTHFAYTSQSQGVRYEVERTVDRDRFISALEDPELFVLYMGHARFGRGPCFGRVFNSPRQGSPATGEVWQQGLFRHGFPHIGVPVSELVEHGYKTFVSPASQTLVQADCDPLLKQKFSSLKKKPLREVVPADALSLIQGLAPDDLVWTFRAFQHGETSDFLVHVAGWEDTSFPAVDLGKTAIACRGYFDCACSTEPLHRDVVVNRKGFKQSEDRFYSFFTTEASDMFDGLAFLYHMLAYGEPNRFRPWKAVLDHAKTEANKDLAAYAALSRIK